MPLAILDPLPSRPKTPSAGVERPTRAARARAELVHLPRRGVLVLEPKGSVLVECLHGELWITTPKGTDHVLAAGQSLRLEGAGKFAVEALRDASLWLTRASAR